MTKRTFVFARTLAVCVSLSIASSLGHTAVLQCSELLVSEAAPLIITDSDLPQLFRQLSGLAKTLKGTSNFNSPRAWRSSTAGYGLPGLDLPKSVGGSALSATDLVKTFQFMGNYSLDMRDMVGGAHARLLLPSSEPEVQRILQKTAQGQAYVAVAITEPQAGSNLRAMQSTATNTEGGYILNGEKKYIARLQSCTHVVIFTQAANQYGGSGKLSAFVLPIDYPGLKITQLDSLGLKGNSFGGLSFENVFVPEKYRIGKDGEGGKIFNNHFLYWRLMMAATALGTAKGALDQAAERLLARSVWNEPLARFTHLQQQLAEHHAKLTMLNLLIDKAAHQYDLGQIEGPDGAAVLSLMAKADGVEFAFAASDFAMKVFGAVGYTQELDLAQRVTDLMGLRIADGTTDVLRQEIVRRSFGQAFWDAAVGGIKGTRYAEDVYSFLQKKHMDSNKTLANQGEYSKWIVSGGGGACASATMFNLLQGLRVMAQQQGFFDPMEIMTEAFSIEPELRKGRVTNQQMTKLFQHFTQKYFSEEQDLKISEDADINMDALKSKANELKLIIYTIEGRSKIIYGRHFVVLKKRIDSETVSVIDPSRPEKDYVYKLQKVRSSYGKDVIELIKLNKTPGDLILTLESSFTISL